MPISRKYLCDDCSGEFSRILWDPEDPIPECPYCASAAARNIPGSFSIKTNRSRAIDFTQETMEAMGHTDFNDNQREGDIAAKAPPPIQTAEAEAMIREMKDAGMIEGDVPDTLMPQVQNFWQKGAPGQESPTAVPQAPSAPPESGTDPMELLHKAGKQGAFGRNGDNYAVYGRAKTSDLT